MSQDLGLTAISPNLNFKPMNVALEAWWGQTGAKVSGPIILI